MPSNAPKVLQPNTYIAEADLVAHRFVKAGTAADGVIVCTAGAKAVGVTIDDANNGEATAIADSPSDKPLVESSAAISAGAEIMSDGSGKAVTATSTNKIVGYALAAAAASGQLIPVALTAHLAPTKA